jgi:hypothetical protein
LIIRIALLLLISAFAAFGLADFLLELALPLLPESITQLGLGLLLCAFTLLIMTGLWLLATQIITAIRVYFSASQRKQRYLLFIQTRQQHIKQRFQQCALRLDYFHELKKRQLLRRNQQKHLHSLSKAIDQDLQALKTRLPKTLLKQYQRENRAYRKQQDSAALLALQQKIHHDR